MNASSGGQQIDGGFASSSIIRAEGTEIVSGGLATGSKIRNRGAQIISSGGTASGSLISRGGTETVYAGGLDQSSIISSGGMEFIGSAGTVSGTTILSGGALTISTGGLVSGGLTLSGGVVSIAGSVSPGQVIDFAGSGGDLELSNLLYFAAGIGGFSAGDALDIAGYANGSTESVSFKEAANHKSGTLTLKDGGLKASFTLLGTYNSAGFGLFDDGHGGSFVKYT